MNFKVGEKYSGFKLIHERKVEEVNSISRLFYHEKSGARLFHLENQDDNKVFSISFRTPPKDSTGVPHVLEHSVLCGSRKFPVKEPFVELIKGSLNTFLNAMTFADKTMYPVASRNDKDFYNLMDIYMDAVLYPNIYKYPEILMQEGWHYELNSKDEDITYKGVVYNEMKGAFSSPESILLRKISESLFPDTIYGVESGGDPDIIPNLTQKQFEDFHRKYYHPSNSYIFLYGNGNILEQLKFLNDNYLKDFNKIEVDSSIALQKPFEKLKESTVEYPISPNEKEEDKTYLSLNFVVGQSTDPELYLAFDILEYLLLENPAAPLKKALIEAGIGKDVFGSFDSSILQPTFSIVVKNSNENKKEKFKQIVFDTLKDLVKDGIDKKLIEASINIKEFNLREADFQTFPKGLIYNIKCMDSWLYDKDPILHLQYTKQLKNIKQGLNTKYFEEIIEKYILNNTHSSLLLVKPKKGLSEEKAKEVRKKLQKYKTSLSLEEIEKIVNQTKKLKKRQSTSDSLEQLNKIPLLSIKDVNTRVDSLPLIEKEELGVKVLNHPIFTNKIVYVNLYFDTSGVDESLLHYVSFLSRILGKVSTKNYTYEKLSNEVNINTGGINFSCKAYSDVKLFKRYYPKFVVKAKVLVDKLPELFELLKEEVMYSIFDDKNRLREIIREIKSRLEMILFDSGHIAVLRRVNSYFLPSSKYNETLMGLSFYKFIVNLEKDFDDKVEEIKNNLKQVSDIIFNKDNLVVSVTLEEEDYNIFKNNFYILYDSLGNKKLNPLKYDFNFSKRNEGLMTSGKVQYVGKAYNFKYLDYNYKGSMQVLKTIVNYDYLWNKVRVQGGAYGCFANFEKNGNMAFVSYRDPNLKDTLKVYDSVEKYLKNFKASNREMTKYIIGTISRLDTPLTPSMKGERSDLNYFSHISQQDLQREREEVLNTKVEDVNEISDLVLRCMKENYLCVLGNEDKIKDDKNVFNNLINVFE